MRIWAFYTTLKKKKLQGLWIKTNLKSFARFGKRFTMDNCNLTTCRYNNNGKCANEEKQKECVTVSKLVLCIEVQESDRQSN